MLTKKKSLAIIDAAFTALPYVAHGFGDMSRHLFNLNLVAEKNHRAPRGGRHGITAQAAARLFVVQHLASSLLKPHKWAVPDILHVRVECLIAQAYVAENGPAIQKAWGDAGVSIPEVMSVDYALLMQTN